MAKISGAALLRETAGVVSASVESFDMQTGEGFPRSAAMTAMLNARNWDLGQSAGPRVRASSDPLAPR